jgi:predicted NACHT family NTPase
MSLTIPKSALQSFAAKAKKDIAAGALKEVLVRMSVFFQHSPRINKIIQQQARLSKLAEQIHQGTVTLDDQVTTENKIRLSTLEILEFLSEQNFDDEIVKAEIDEALSQCKNLVVDSAIHAQVVKIGDTIINNYYNSTNKGSLNEFEESLLLQQRGIVQQYLVIKGDEMYINLPKQKRVKETLSFSTTIVTGQKAKDLTDVGIEKIFIDECLSSMLVLGEPGSGKTSLLAELGYRLAERTLQENKGYIPIFINLSSWSSYRKTKNGAAIFWDWLQSELKGSYGIKGSTFKEILLSKRIVFLFDGLDEVAESDRLNCLRSFNNFIYENRVPVVISCRRIEYDL